MRIPRRSLLLAAWPVGARAQAVLTVAAASDLRFVLDELLKGFDAQGRRIEVVYGSSGKLATQVRNGAPFDLYLAADQRFSAALAAEGFAAGPSQRYARGFLVAWSPNATLGRLPLPALVEDARLRRLAIANPLHAPYGQRAEQALRALKLWDLARPKLVLADNIAQAAQFVQSGAAQAGLLALSLVLAPALAGQGAYTRMAQQLYEPLDQGFIVTRRAASDALAARLAQHLRSPAACQLWRRYGFEAL